MGKRRSSKEPRPRGEFHDLVEEEHRARARKAKETDRELARLKPARLTKFAIMTVAWGPTELRTGLRRMDVRTLKTAVWAKRIRSAAQAWRVCPGAAIIRQEPNLRCDVGMEIASRIFLRAMEKDLSAEEIRGLLDQAVDARGPFYYEERERLGPAVELIEFFRQLSQCFDGTGWVPPNNWTTSPKRAISQPPEEVRQVRKSAPEPGVENLRDALTKLRLMEPSRRLPAEEVIAMYGLGPLDAEDFVRSPRYVARKAPHRPDQLPRSAAAGHRSAGGKFESTASWSRDEVIAAVKGKLARATDDSTGPF